MPRRKGSIKTRPMRVYDVWIEGTRIQNVTVKARYLGQEFAESFYDACADAMRRNYGAQEGKNVRTDKDGTPMWWRCRFFERESEAKKRYG